LGTRVVHYDFESGLVRLKSGQELQADIVVAVDGIHSVARKEFLPDIGDGLERTGWAAFRAIVPVDKIKANPQTAHIVAQHKCNCWVGDQNLVMTYLINNAEILNMAFSHLDDVDTSTWTSERYQAELKKLCCNWDPALTALLDMVSPNIQNWPVQQVKSLPTWKSKSGRFVLMGDVSCFCLG
jgi:salicylate hydroxylase